MSQRSDFVSFPGKIHLISNDQELALAIPLLQVSDTFGFDTETRPSFAKGEFYKVALLQLATENDVFLIRLQKISQFNSIKEIFENDEIIKVGVAVRDDLKNLQKTFKFTPKNFIELQNLAKEIGLQNFGLKGMAEELLNLKVTKGPKLTNWETHTLSEDQKNYAATDSWISLKLFHALADKNQDTR